MTRAMAMLASALLAGCSGKGTTGDLDATGDSMGDTVDDPPSDALDSTAADTLVTDGPVTDTVQDPVPPDVTEDVTTDGGWIDTPTLLANARTVFGTMSMSMGEEGDPDHPQIVTTASGEVWAGGRIMNEVDSPKLAYRKLDPASPSLAASPLFTTIDDTTLEPLHPTAALGDTLVTVLRDVDGFASNQMVHRSDTVPPSDALAMAGFGSTGPGSSDPAVAASGGEALAVWRQESGTGSTLMFGRVGSTGAELGTGSAAGDGTGNLGRPDLGSNGVLYGLAYFDLQGPGADTAHFVALNKNGTPVAGTERAWPVLGTDELVGRPAVAWAGGRWAAAFEEVDGSTTAQLRLILVGSDPASDVEVDLDAALSPFTGAFTGSQQGMMDMGYSGWEMGLVIVHDDPAAGARVWLAEVGTDGALLADPFMLNPSAQHSSNPALTWNETDERQYWVFVWNEFSSASAVNVMWGSSYGCEL